MTREEAKELLPVIKALAEGKTIQDKIEGVTDWVDTDEINLEYNGQRLKHRIKPEPKYRPFKTQEECWNEMLKHQPFGWLKSKTNERKVLIESVSGESASSNPYTMVTLSVVGEYSGIYIFEHYMFLDGTPFGIKEEQI